MRYHEQKMSLVEMCMLYWMCSDIRRDNVYILIKIGVIPREEKIQECYLCWFVRV